MYKLTDISVSLYVRTDFLEIQTNAYIYTDIPLPLYGDIYWEFLPSASLNIYSECIHGSSSEDQSVMHPGKIHSQCAQFELYRMYRWVRIGVSIDSGVSAMGDVPRSSDVAG